MLVSKEKIHAYNVSHGLCETTLYRIERKRDKPCGYQYEYQGPFSDHRFTHLTDMDGILPTPCEEGLTHPASGYLTACKSPGLLLSWFNFVGLRGLFKNDFVLGIYRVKHAKHGVHQSVFHPDNIISVQRLDDVEAVFDMIQEDYWESECGVEYRKRKVEAREKRRARKLKACA